MRVVQEMFFGSLKRLAGGALTPGRDTAQDRDDAAARTGGFIMHAAHSINNRAGAYIAHSQAATND